MKHPLQTYEKNILWSHFATLGLAKHGFFRAPRFYNWFIRLFFFLIGIGLANTCSASPDKALICGVCKNNGFAARQTIKNIELLGNRFKDYAVIIYENNSTDDTAAYYSEWAKANDKVVFISENLHSNELPPSRTECIARARNIVLSIARNEKYSDFKYLIMVDCDFIKAPWPIDALMEVTEITLDWDCICSNSADGYIADSYAYRDAHFPFGPEIIGNSWWNKLDFERSTNGYRKGDGLVPVYSAFGGIAIYKRASIIPFSYSGIVTEDLKQYYRHILLSSPKSHHQIRDYLNLIGLQESTSLCEVPIVFQGNTFWEHPQEPYRQTCCEHVPLHASMAIHGFDKIYIYPQMVMVH